jgi:hypothetical protein
MYALEQEIMSCWSIVDDLRVMAEKYENDDEISNLLLGFCSIYGMKFEHLFSTYEKILSERTTTRL